MFVQVYRKRKLIAEMTVDLAAKTVSKYRTYIDDILIFLLELTGNQTT